MRGRSLGFVLIMISAGLALLANSLKAGDAQAIVTNARVLWIIAGAVFGVGLGLLLFKKIILTPWFTIDLSAEKIALNLGPPGFRFTASGLAQKNCIQVPGTQIFLTMSFLTRLVIKLSLSGIPYHYILARHNRRWAIAGAIACLIVLFAIERALLKILAPENLDAEADESPVQEDQGAGITAKS
jgi:hypothetical protein